MVELFYFYKAQKSGWYKWHMTRNMQVPVYEWISPHLGYKKENNNTEYMAILPDDFDDEEEWGDDKRYVFLNWYEMQNLYEIRHCESESDEEYTYVITNELYIFLLHMFINE